MELKLERQPPLRGGCWFLTLVANMNIWGGMICGYNTAIIAIASTYINDEFGLNSFLEGIVTGSLLLGAMIGSLAGGFLCDFIGRKLVAISASVLVIAGALSSAFSPSAYFWVLPSLRLILGLGCGLASTACPMYVSEMSPPKRRGIFGSIFQVSTTLAILLAYVVGYALSFPEYDWRYMLGVGAVPGVANLAVALSVPESSVWRDKKKRQRSSRKKSSEKKENIAATLESKLLSLTAQKPEYLGTPAEEPLLAGEEEEDVEDTVTVPAEPKEVTTSASKHKAPAGGLLGLFYPRNLRILSAALALPVALQLTGINAVIYYAPIIFENAGVSQGNAIFATMGIGAWNFITTFIAVGFVERAGRRPLLLIGLLIVTVSDMALCISSLAIPGQAGSYISIISVFIFIASFEAGIGCVFWIVVTEMFPAEVKDAGLALVNGLQWGGNLLLGMLFPLMVDGIGLGYSYLIFGCLGIGSFIVLVFTLKETKSSEQKKASKKYFCC